MNPLLHLLRALVEDARFALKSLARVPTYTATVVLTLALGIGGVTAVFSVLYGVVLRPPPFPAPDGIAVVHCSFKQVALPVVPLSPSEFLDVRSKSSSFAHVAAYGPGSLNMTGQGEAVRVAAGYVTADFFRVLGSPPVLGRDFAPSEDVAGASRLVILGASFHRRVFGGSPDVLGKVIELDGLPHTVIGVLPPNYDREPRVGEALGEDSQPRDVWVTFRFTPEQLVPTARGGRSLWVLARLKGGTSLREAQRDVRSLGESFFDSYPEAYPRATGYAISLKPLREASGRRAATVLTFLLGAVGLVLLAACANVVSLTLARLATRRREIAVRVALGATGGRIAVQFLVESAVIALAGGALGMVFGRLGMEALLAGGDGSAITSQRGAISFALPVLMFALAVSLGTGLVAGVAPAWHAARLTPTSGLREGGRTTSGGGLRLRSALVVAQVTVALVLLIGTGMVLRSLVALTTRSPGFETKDVYVGTVALSEVRYFQAPVEQTLFVNAAMERVRAIPGVERAGFVSILPLGGWSDRSFRIEGDPVPAVNPNAQFRSVAGDYFATLGIQLLGGRVFGPADTGDGAPVIIVNRTLVSKYFGERDPIGMRIGLRNSPGGPWQPHTIVGVVADTLDMGIDEPVQPFAYVPFAQFATGGGGFVVRAPTLGASVMTAIRAATDAVDASQPLYDEQPLQRLVEGALGSRRFTLRLLCVFAGLGLTLAALGIYGITSYSVAQRTQEIAVRMAMGADDRAVFWLVLSQAMRLVGVGLLAGAAFAAALGKFVASLMYGLEPWDPLAMAALSALLLVSALVAGWLPARRATALPLATALRAE